MSNRNKFAVGIVAAVVLVIGALALLPNPGTSHAQLTCDDPPFDVSNIAQVWDLTDFCTFQEGVFEEIISGGVPRDGIPPIDNPEFDSIAAANEWLEPQSPVIALEIDGNARAYPLAILTRHEIVNDELAGMPIAVTFCPLCNSAIVFDSVIDGETHRFGVSGLLRNSDLVMWDNVTQSWWQQFTGEGIVGAYTGRQLEIVPSTVVGYAAFVEQYPDGEVLSPGGRSYGTNPYQGYDSLENPFLFAGEIDDRLRATERVLAGIIGGEAMAYPFENLAEENVINDNIGDRDVVAFWQPGKASALDGTDIDSSRDVGMAALYSREIEDRILTFSIGDDGAIIDDETGSVWNVFGSAVEGELAGTQLRQLTAAPHFWFAWAAFHPETAVYGLEA